MNLLFLGTSSGVPTKDRNVTGIALQESEGSAWYLIDCGEGTQHQLLHTRLSLNTLRALFITHVHGDHCYGLPGLLASAAMSGRRSPLQIIGPAALHDWLEATRVCSQLFLPFDIDFTPVEPLPRMSWGNTAVSTCPLSHRVPSYAYSFVETTVEPMLDTAALMRDGVPRGPAWGQLQQGCDVLVDGRTIRAGAYLSHARYLRKIVIAGDNDQPELLTDACLGAQVLVHEATYTADVAAKVGSDFGHSHARQVAAFAQSVQLPNLVLTHFSARYRNDGDKSPSMADIANEAGGVYSGKLHLAQDFARYSLDKHGSFKRCD